MDHFYSDDDIQIDSVLFRLEFRRIEHISCSPVEQDERRTNVMDLFVECRGLCRISLSLISHTPCTPGLHLHH
jgi:hypothetical protein